MSGLIQDGAKLFSSAKITQVETINSSITMSNKTLNIRIQVIYLQNLIETNTNTIRMSTITRLEICSQNKEFQTLYLACNSIFYF